MPRWNLMLSPLHRRSAACNRRSVEAGRFRCYSPYCAGNVTSWKPDARMQNRDADNARDRKISCRRSTSLVIQVRSGSIASLRRCAHFRSSPINGHHQTASVGPVGAGRRHSRVEGKGDHLAGPNTSTLSKGLAAQGRNRFRVNFVVCPGVTSTRR
jgi:hypothetical protein